MITLGRKYFILRNSLTNALLISTSQHIFLQGIHFLMQNLTGPRFAPFLEDAGGTLPGDPNPLPRWAGGWRFRLPRLGVQQCHLCDGLGGTRDKGCGVSVPSRLDLQTLE